MGVRLGIGLWTIVLLAGCSSDGKPQPVPVSGTVLYKGQPVPGAQVVFLSKGTSPAAVGNTDDGGNFSLSTYDEEDGAVPGDYSVTVVKMQGSAGADPNAPFDPVADMEAAARNTAPPPPAKSLLPTKYGAAATSGLQFTVAASGSNQFKIELTD